MPATPTGGVVTLGSYTIDLMQEMGRGTFGTVYKGHHTKTKAIVAVKKMQVSYYLLKMYLYVQYDMPVYIQFYF